MTKGDLPKNLESFIDVLGIDAAIDFFLRFGGAPIYIAADPKSRSSVADQVGREKALALAERFGPGHLRVPTAKRWIAQRLHAKGETVVGIARRLHVSDVAVRGYLKAEDRQLTLF